MCFYKPALHSPEQIVTDMAFWACREEPFWDKSRKRMSGIRWQKLRPERRLQWILWRRLWWRHQFGKRKWQLGECQWECPGYRCWRWHEALKISQIFPMFYILF